MYDGQSRSDCVCAGLMFLLHRRTEPESLKTPPYSTVPQPCSGYSLRRMTIYSAKRNDDN